MKKERKLFCELSPVAYDIAVYKCIMLRNINDLFSRTAFARTKSENLLPNVVCSHNSLIERKLGHVDTQLQKNKAINLALSTPKVSHILIQPNETFSFWKLVKRPTKKKGYKEGLTISLNEVSKGIGGGMCQFTNLIHWMVLHTPLEIVEHHHHDNLDLFPDYGRQIPFGSGTSIMYNYIDYRFTNPTNQCFQLIVYTNDKYLCGELRSEYPLDVKYHIKVMDEHFSKEAGIVYRNSQIYREQIDKKTGKRIKYEFIKSNHARVMYDTSHLDGIE